MTFDGDLQEARAGLAVTLTLADEIDISRGDLIVLEQDQVESTNHLLADVVWMTEQPLQPGRDYDVKIAGKKTVGQVSAIRHQYDINNLSTYQAAELPLNGIGLCGGRSISLLHWTNISTAQTPVVSSSSTV